MLKLAWTYIRLTMPHKTGEWRSQIQFAIDANGFVPKEKNDDDKSTSSACIFH